MQEKENIIEGDYMDNLIRKQREQEIVINFKKII